MVRSGIVLGGDDNWSSFPLRVETETQASIPAINLQGIESISSPFLFDVELPIPKQGDCSNLLHQRVRVVWGGLQSERLIHGIVRSIRQTGQTEGFDLLHLEVVPWLWFLSLSVDCRIFQNLTVPEIVTRIFSSEGWSDFRWEIKARSYAPREYCVQYRETNLNFVSRLLEDEGMFYYFEHAVDRHVLVLADDSKALATASESVLYESRNGEEPPEKMLHSISIKRMARPGQVTLVGYDFQTPARRLQSTLETSPRFNIYEYFLKSTRLETAEHYAQIRLEELSAQEFIMEGRTSDASLQSGGVCAVKAAPGSDLDGRYLILTVKHSARNDVQNTSVMYENNFVAIPVGGSYRPPRVTPVPILQGVQTAVVVGPAGELVYVDIYGRVKVQFHWDREGTRSEMSSCWVRVSQSVPSNSPGKMWIPLIGQEVVIAFLEGDPDAPIVTGYVYNAERMPPLALPAEAITIDERHRLMGLPPILSSPVGSASDQDATVEHASERRLRVFLCHSSEDKAAVRQLSATLRGCGIDPWLDEEKLLPGQNWESEITKAVRGSDAVLVCLSPAISRPAYLHREIKEVFAVADQQPDGTIFLIPVLLAECEVPERFAPWHWVNLYKNNGFDKLILALQSRAKSLGAFISSVEKPK